MAGPVPSALVAAVRQFVALVFLLGGGAKALDPAFAQQAVHSYRILPVALARPFALALPWVELATGGALLIGVLVPWAAGVGLLLLLVFAVAQGIVLLRGQEVACGCFGSLSARPVRWSNVLVNVVLACGCLLIGPPQVGWGTRDPAVLPLRETVLTQIAATVLLVQVLVLEQLLQNRLYEKEFLAAYREHLAGLSVQAVTSPEVTGP